MNDGLGELAMAMAVFVAAHMIPSHRPLRRALIGIIGEWGFRGVYSVLSLGLFWWLLGAYQRAPYVELFAPINLLSYLSIILMLPACIFVVGGYSIANPSAVVLEKLAAAGEVPGILKITRHPVLWAMAIWGVAHMIANPDGAAWILFGSLAALSAAGSIHMDRRKRADGTAGWARIEAETSNVPFAALITGRTRVTLAEIGWLRIAGGVVLYAVLLAAHEAVIGVAPLPV